MRWSEIKILDLQVRDSSRMRDTWPILYTFIFFLCTHNHLLALLVSGIGMMMRMHNHLINVLLSGDAGPEGPQGAQGAEGMKSHLFHKSDSKKIIMCK